MKYIFLLSLIIFPSAIYSNKVDFNNDFLYNKGLAFYQHYYKDKANISCLNSYSYFLIYLDFEKKNIKKIKYAREVVSFCQSVLINTPQYMIEGRGYE